MKFFIYAICFASGGLLLSYLLRRHARRQPVATIVNILHPELEVIHRDSRALRVKS